MDFSLGSFKKKKKKKKLAVRNWGYPGLLHDVVLLRLTLYILVLSIFNKVNTVKCVDTGLIIPEIQCVLPIPMGKSASNANSLSIMKIPCHSCINPH